MRRLIPLLFLTLILAGCGNATTQTATAPVSKADIAALEVSVTEAVKVANLCLTNKVGPCGVVTSRAVIIADIHEAGDAFHRLQTASASGQAAALAAANEALLQLTNVTPVITPAK